jgi:hypothetical protein
MPYLMGSHETRRKIGSARSLLEPPVPLLAVADGELISFSAPGDNSLGKCTLYLGPTENGPWSYATDEGWNPEVDFGAAAGYTGNYAYSQNTGNGVTFTGLSRRSNIIQL